MRKHIKKQILLTVFLLISPLTSCGLTQESLPAQDREAAESVPDRKEDQEVLKENPETVQPEEIVNTPKEDMVFSERYYYKNLNEDEQMVYAYLYEKIASLASKINFEREIDSIVFHKSYYALVQDCPEFFWLDSNMIITTMEKSGNVASVEISFDQISSEEIQQQKDAVEGVANAWISEVDPELSQYEKIKRIFEMIVERTEYVEGAQYNQDVRSVFLNGQSVCAGYAKALEYLLTKMDISCTLVNGEMIGGELHCWNLVNIDGNYYWIDVTQGDASADQNITNYAYLCFDDTILERNYTIDKQIGLSTMPDQESEFFQYPSCVNTDYNYFRLQGTGYDVFDLPAIQERVYVGIDEGVRLFSFQFYDEGTFSEAVQAMEDQSLLGDALQKLMAQQEVETWKYQYSNDPRVYVIYLIL